MNEELDKLIINLNQRAKLKYLITIYESNSNFYAEASEVMNGTCLSSSPLTKETLSEIVSLAKIEEDKSRNYQDEINDNLVFISDDTIIWKWKGRKKTIKIDKETINIKIPNLMFMYKKSTLYIKAVKGKKFFHCPLPNIYNDSHMCVGNIALEKHFASSKIINYMEEMFFNSTFTHFNNEYLSTEDKLIPCGEFKI